MSMTPEKALAFVDGAADGGLGAPDYAEAYWTLKEVISRAHDLENELTEQSAILGAIMGALKGEEPCDFMRSYPDVEHAWWIYRLAYPATGDFQ